MKGMNKNKSNNSSSSSSACPYASKLIVKERTLNEKEEHSNEALQAIELAKKSCPAFQSSTTSTTTCPFRSVNNSSEFKKAMLSIPSSHYENKDNKTDIPKQFKLALEHMHEVSQSLHDNNSGNNAFVLDGGCPFKSYYESSENESVPFIAAMEHFSLTGIMAALASPSPSDNKDVASNSNGNDNDNEQIEQEPQRRDSLSKALKSGTAASHKAAENVHFVRNFIKQKVELHLYKQMVIGLYFTYKALEEQLDRYGPTHFPSLYQPHKLARTEALKLDLCYFYGEHWEEEVEPETSPTIQDYIDRIHHIASSDPILLLAHAYTRYLGDLSGGRVLARIAKKALNLPETALNFYNFKNIPNAKEFKNYYRYQLDQLSLHPHKITCMVQEANVAFVLNMRMFEELDVLGGEPGAKVRPLAEALQFRAEEDDDNQNKECPFATMAREAKQEMKSCPRQKTNLLEKTEGKRCPWPFVFMHDPAQGMKDYQTWIVIGLFFCYLFKFVKSFL